MVLYLRCWILQCFLEVGNGFDSNLVLIDARGGNSSEQTESDISWPLP